MRWSEAVTLEFVKIYLKQECLWNPSHAGYKTKYQRQKAYIDIKHNFEASTGKCLNIMEVKLKIKNLRTTYSQQVHKILEKSSPDNIYEPSLVWFHEMDRCLKHVSTNRHSLTYNHNSSHENPEVDSSSQIWVDQSMPSGTTDNNHSDPLVPQTQDEIEIIKAVESHRIKTERKRSPSLLKRMKKKKNKRSPIRDYFTDSNSETTAKYVNTNSKEDEFDIYGKYIASQLRKMDIQKALRLQLEIQSLVSEARISEIVSE